jgi:hypothetical protein
MDKFLNFYTKYPWVAIVIVIQWLATAFMLIYASDVDVAQIMGMTFLATVIFAYFGFKIPKE